MDVKFGTSGLRGLVVDMTPDLIANYTRAFVQVCDTGRVVLIGRDLRDSSPDMAAIVARTARAEGCEVHDCGAVPTPALALMAAQMGAGAVMVTGSHIPADRNGLKFYSRAGEILKSDEQAINAAFSDTGDTAPDFTPPDLDAGGAFVARYVDAFGPTALQGRRIGVHTHSAVGRDLMMEMLSGLGAQVIELGRSDHFIPVDTEAVDSETRQQLRNWVVAHDLVGIVSTDGDSDRPMLTDETGQVIAGDILGQITSAYLGADVVVTPISSNSGVLQRGFCDVITTRIGSPYVIEAMQSQQGQRVAGYEANGGFLLGFETQNGLKALLTRDSFLPVVVPLLAAGDLPLSAAVAREPARFTAADRVQGVEPVDSAKFVEKLRCDSIFRAEFVLKFGDEPKDVNNLDGCRIVMASGDVVHLRPSGNAPELRVYAESDRRDRALEVVEIGMKILNDLI